MKTSGNRVLITGGSSGIGLELAKKFISENNTVIITGRSVKKLQAAKEMIPEIITEVADITCEADSLRLAEKHDINILINNAGIQHRYKLTDSPISNAAVREEIDTNFTGQVILTRAFLPGLMAKKSAAIINITSLLSIVPKENAPVYCATKAAFSSFTKSLRWQLSDTPVKVFEIVPPLVGTALAKDSDGDKISPEMLVADFWKRFERDIYTVYIRKSKVVFYLNRFLPGFIEKMIRFA